MERLHKTVDTEALLETYRTLLQETECLPLVISGSSMVPFLVDGRDTVFLTKVDRPIVKGDMVLYKRDCGRYILHRVCRVYPDRFDIVGDAQTQIEKNVRRDQICALVCRAERKGKTEKPGTFWWDFFEKIWIRMIALRPFILRCYTKISTLAGRNHR